MSRIPDCRKDDVYNEKYLQGNDAEFIDGFDWTVEMGIMSFFDDLENYTDEDSYLGHLLFEEVPDYMRKEYNMPRKFPRGTDNEPYKMEIITYKDLLLSYILEHIEGERDMLITSMIDNMGDEFEQIKAEIDGKEHDNGV